MFVCSLLVTVVQTKTDASSNPLRWDCCEMGAQLFLSSLCISWPRNWRCIQVRSQTMRWPLSYLGGTVTIKWHLLDIMVSAFSFAYQALLMQGSRYHQCVVESLDILLTSNVIQQHLQHSHGEGGLYGGEGSLFCPADTTEIVIQHGSFLHTSLMVPEAQKLLYFPWGNRNEYG